MKRLRLLILVSDILWDFCEQIKVANNGLGHLMDIDWIVILIDIFLFLVNVAVPPLVVRNDEWTWEEICHYLYEENAFDNIVISPGPGSPTCPGDIG